MTIAFNAGQLVTAGQMNLLAPILKFKAANQSVVNSVTLVNDNDIVFTFVANQTVHIQANWAYQMSVTNFGVQIGWTPSGTISTLFRGIHGVASAGSAGTPTNVTNTQWQATNSLGPNIYAGTTVNSTYYAREELLLTTGASGGSMQMTFANGFSGTDTSTMMANTFAIARYVA